MSKFSYYRHSEVDRNVELDLEALYKFGTGDMEIFLRRYYELEFAAGQVFADADENCYPNASFSVLQFIANLRLIKNRCSQDARFLDVGCGLGSKVGIAQSLGFDAYGLEINPQYAAIASEQVGPNRILCTDAVGFREYGNFDVIYFYNPMVSGEIEQAIMANAKLGAIVYHAITLHSKPRRKHSRLTSRVLRFTDSAPNESVAVIPATCQQTATSYETTPEFLS